MTLVKKVNYPPEMVKTMLEVYGAAENTDEARQEAMEKLSEQFGRTVASIRAKLSFERVYIAKAKPEKSGGTRILKSDIVSLIAKNSGEKNAEFFESLAGANRAVLDYIVRVQTDLAWFEAGENVPEPSE